jgi:hypothetical protein
LNGIPPEGYVYPMTPIYSSNAEIKVCKTLEEVNKLGLKSDTEVYKYDFKTNTLTQLYVKPIVEKIKEPAWEREEIKGYRVP